MRLARAVCVVVAAGALAPAAADARARSLYVRAGEAAEARGTRQAPLTSRAAVEAASRPRDRIVVLPGGGVLDGGIALKPRQGLVGAGPAPSRIANTDPSRLDGDAVRLADGVTV